MPIEEAFDVADGFWRGLGKLPSSPLMSPRESRGERVLKILGLKIHAKVDALKGAVDLRLLLFA